MKRAVIAGASGMVGTRLVKALIEKQTYDEIHLISRRRTLFHRNPLITEHIVHFDELDRASYVFEEGDHVFVLLGTTMKQAGSKANFVRVDYTYPLKLAELAKAGKAAQFLTVTAMGANRDSTFFYNRVKGRFEDELIKMKLPALHIFRPSLLIGERNDVRPGEKAAEVVARPLMKWMTGRLEKYRPVEGEQLADAMLTVAGLERTGFYLYESDDIQAISQYGRK
ncbi:NAD-dependent epimerase/dehydratase family protein [Salisediminibacterium selenitireducens]|uniref:NAD-dependent epimerase/dehydratase n=1 Tax=Bacillus selenitireducens (strain ATCC 700615 / DSM 15326 / MLS10) TaxID=439292 RepID=D6Y1C9_BACIE|nr:NAD-dependent epimerase/dehydratase family protein [Salisediminibacterium selenitireducens]ADI00716.1 NAD-dependent epimerase/dehydratase [[Bacillus] selenitireducens MLS10]